MKKVEEVKYCNSQIYESSFSQGVCGFSPNPRARIRNRERERDGTETREKEVRSNLPRRLTTLLGQ